jgi:hypothetical protein
MFTLVVREADEAAITARLDEAGLMLAEMAGSTQRAGAVEAILATGHPAAIPFLSRLVDQEDVTAVFALTRFRGDPRAVAALALALASTSPPVVDGALTACDRIGQPASDQDVLRLLASRTPEIAMAALGYLRNRFLADGDQVRVRRLAAAGGVASLTTHRDPQVAASARNLLQALAETPMPQ